METNQRRKILIVGLLLGMFFASLDQTIVGTAMPRVVSDLQGLDIFVWVTTAYMLSSTTVVPIAGKLADIFGRRIMYVLGIVIFMLGSALSGQAHSMTALILSRALQGIGGGVMMPMAMTIVGDIFPPAQRGKWQGLMAALFGLSSIVGPTIGGWIVDHSSWRWVFYINIPVGILAAATIFVGLSGEKQVKAKDHQSIDYAGVITLILGVVPLLLGLSLGGRDYAWNSWQILSLFVTAIVCLGSFIWIEKKAKDPILSLHLFKNRVFTSVNLVGFLMGFGMFGAITFLPLYLQGVLGVSATSSGNTMIPMMAAMMLTSILGGKLVTRIPFRTQFALGMSTMAIGFYLMSTMNVYTSQSTAIFNIIFLGLGIGLVMPTLTIAVQSVFPPAERGVVTAATQFFRSIGSTLGMTILGVVMNHYSASYLQTDFIPAVSKLPTMQTGPLAGMLSKANTDPQGLFNILLSPDTLNNIPQSLQQVMLPPLKLALANSLHYVFLVAMGIVFFGIVVSLLMGDARIEGEAASKPKVKLEAELNNA
ncbi:MDR family MFS transporter [Desulfosporosinus sp. OT]|uniref:MDR family MFS transporter n=1 Tax=Desulfosporosinus sp. OT TaxID=913865 RepID=UPI0002239FB5|nr:MDR family MFS transporter [Desulfosporosinus sp. OT]EGW40045.1 drug resistance MFS transporter, drug:H+ antiporter-1 family protein [Desulfosporosinus sp. OT]